MTRERLPPAVTVLGTLGLAILALCTLPAVRAHQGLVAEHARLRGETRAVAQEVERLRQELRDGQTQRYLRVRATHELLHRGGAYIDARDRRLGRGAHAPAPEPDAND